MTLYTNNENLNQDIEKALNDTKIQEDEFYKKL